MLLVLQAPVGSGDRSALALPPPPQGPFGLPPRLRLAALARRGGRTLRARSDRYLYTLYTVAVFYALPVVQFVIAFQIVSSLASAALVLSCS